jgi:magnesium chelatase subunit D
MAAAKGAVLSLLLKAYQQRDEVGLIAFRGPTADLLLPLTRSVELASTRLRDLPTGGLTPLAAGLRLAHATLTQRRLTAGNIGSTLIVLVSDGRANVAADGGDAHAEALAAAQALRASGAAALVVDAEEGPIRLGFARRIGGALHAHYMRLADLSARSNFVAAVIRSAHA